LTTYILAKTHTVCMYVILFIDTHTFVSGILKCLLNKLKFGKRIFTLILKRRSELQLRERYVECRCGKEVQG
jgi:hypothetical protein